MYEEEYNEDEDDDREGRDSESGDESFKKPSKSISKTDEFVVEEVDTSPLAEHTDYQRIQTRRIFIDKWISEPFFDQVVKGSFVRLFVGVQNDVQIYRMCEVLDVLPYKRPYRLPGTDITVDRALLVGLGSSQKVAKMYHVSNSRILEKEFQFYVNTMKACREEDKLLRKNVSRCWY
jgi:RNA polymerase-associated protein RTF1